MNKSTNDSDYVDALSKQLKVDKYDPNIHKPQQGVTEILDMDQARKYKVVPISSKGGLLLVAMTDPSDIRTLDEVQKMTRQDVEPLICTERELEGLATLVYGANLGLFDIMDDVNRSGEEYDDDDRLRQMEDVSIDDVAQQANDAPIIRLVNALLVQAVREGASDIHISPEKDAIQLRYRVDGELVQAQAPPKKMFMAIASRVKLMSGMDISVTRVPQDGRFSFTASGKEVSVRASALPTVWGENIVLRLLSQGSKSLNVEDLGLQPREQDKFEKAVKKPYGMVLATGPTGSGKSTLLYALIKSINKPNTNIITLEDPVEYRVKGIRQVQLNRKAGMTFASGLRSILRQDPNVIMVGEIRDSETASIAVESALTGHLVLSTLHTNTAAGAITRFVEMGIEPFLVASTLLVAGAQRLVRRICPNCIEAYEAPIEALTALGLEPIKGTLFLRGKGCYKCSQSGFSGRVGIYEVLEMSNAIKDMVIKNAATHEIEEMAIKKGLLHSLIMDAADKVLRGYTTLEEAASAVLV